MADFEVNKQGLLINGVAKNVGDIINETDVGSQLNALRGAGKIREVGLSKNQAFTDPHIFNGIGRTFVTGEAVGTGDGIQTVFTLGNSPVIDLTFTIFVDGTAQTEGVDFTIDLPTGQITFTSAPGDTLPITADYQHHIVIS